MLEGQCGAQVHVDLVAFLILLPTKTSQLFNQFLGSAPCFSSGGDHVAFTRCLNFASLLILVVEILSSVSLALIAFSQHDLISPSVCCFPLITLSQRRTHIRWANSDIMICIRHVGPLVRRALLSWAVCCSSGWAISLGAIMLPHPSISPRLMFGHS